jgi:TIR domain
MADVFLSYAREEADVAKRLEYLFKCEDWSCWWDLPSIGLGQDFRPLVVQALEEAKVVLVLWSPASRSSSWVRCEVEHARHAGRLLEFAIRPEGTSPGPRNGPFEIPTHPHIPPIRDEVLRRVAEAGGLVRRSDGWNSCIIVSNRRQRPPKQPVIGWEWVNPGTDAHRLVRRERWNEGVSATYGTTIGNAWLFGEENSCAPIGYIFVTEARHAVLLPDAPKGRERNPFVAPFNIDVRLAEFMSGFKYPDGGVNLGDPEFSGQTQK